MSERAYRSSGGPSSGGPSSRGPRIGRFSRTDADRADIDGAKAPLDQDEKMREWLASFPFDIYTVSEAGINGTNVWTRITGVYFDRDKAVHRGMLLWKFRNSPNGPAEETQYHGQTGISGLHFRTEYIVWRACCPRAVRPDVISEKGQVLPAVKGAKAVWVEKRSLTRSLDDFYYTQKDNYLSEDTPAEFDDKTDEKD